MVRFIFITGGVVSSLGKGLTAASLACLLKARGYTTKLRKLDPYLNIDPGTMSPYQHGEVFVTDDGAETDLDLGHYERFTGTPSQRGDNVTAGKIYSELLTKERKGDYLGGTVQVIPHVTNLIKAFILNNCDNVDFLICEIGGTVGDIEALPFFETIRQLGNEFGRDRVMYIHLTLVPYLSSTGELKTKPTQHSVKELRSIGIQPNLLICRSEYAISLAERSKIALFCNLPESCVIQALDQKNIYSVPISYHAEGLDREVLRHFSIYNAPEADLNKWHEIIERFSNPQNTVSIAIVGKYNSLPDAYKSLIEAFIHSGIYHQCKVELNWIDSSTLTEENITESLSHSHGIMVPGGFGERGTEGKIIAIKYARENKIPYFGVCLGMQLACIEIARNLLKIPDATSTEFTNNGTNVIALITEWSKDGQQHNFHENDDLGGTMRLGSFPCDLTPGSKVHQIYKSNHIAERHRHRWEFNLHFKPEFLKVGVNFSGMSPDGELTEIIELPDHPWFIGVQFHPELKSRPFEPHPLFVSFIEAAIKYKS